MDDAEKYRDAAITQAFYTVNKCHDLYYTLGFNEVAGNFQANNNGKGGFEDDHVIVSAQTGTKTNNAEFEHTLDGESPRIWLYLFNQTTPVRDVAFDQSVVTHEYIHGVSGRLTGGSLSQCLVEFESMGLGEGWSDFMALAIGLKPSDKQFTDHVIGAWVKGNPRGARNYPYSTDMDKNPLLFEDNNGEESYYFIGNYWANVLFEIMWDMISKHGRSDDAVPKFRPDTVIPSDGRCLTMRLVMDGMALQPCNPTLIHARDAILDADLVLTGGKNLCELWKAFARRGLGSDAKHLGQGFGDQRINSFDRPSRVCS